jgi:hypothetical protein
MTRPPKPTPNQASDPASAGVERAPLRSAAPGFPGFDRRSDQSAPHLHARFDVPRMGARTIDPGDRRIKCGPGPRPKPWPLPTAAGFGGAPVAVQTMTPSSRRWRSDFAMHHPLRRVLRRPSSRASPGNIIRRSISCVDLFGDVVKEILCSAGILPRPLFAGYAWSKAMICKRFHGQHSFPPASNQIEKPCKHLWFMTPFDYRSLAT